MPNTLAHFGIQALGSRLIFRHASCKWIALGCILPDIPWVCQRFLSPLLPDELLLGLRLYTMIQASLCFSLVLAAALTLLLGRGTGAFLVLAGNVLAHLFLDALQIKWANGVHFLAPLSWNLSGFGLFWPESWPTYLLTSLGLLAFVACLVIRKTYRTSVPHAVRSPGRLGFAMLLLLVYLALPLVLLAGPLQQNCHYTGTLREREKRPGRYIEIDRGIFSPQPAGSIRIFTGERLKLQGRLPAEATILSLQGAFTSQDTIQVSRYHVHSRLRDLASLAGLAATFILWLPDLIRCVRKQ